MTEAENLEKAEKLRRGAKSTFTRDENSMKTLINSNQPVDLVKEALQKLVISHDKAMVKHDNYCFYLSDADYETQEKWADEIQERLDIAKCQVRTYELKNSSISGANKGQSSSLSQTPVSSGAKKFRFQMAKAPLPTFEGGLIDYYPFKTDFEFLFRTNIGSDDDEKPLTELLSASEKREAVYMLKNACLKGEALKWIDGEVDFDQAWEILDINYGDPRLVSNALLEKLDELPVLKENDPKMSLLFHLAKKANAVLSQVNCEKDLDNATTLSQLEKKLHTKDRIRWAEIQRHENMEPNLTNFMNFLKDEIWIRKKAGTGKKSLSGTSGNVSLDPQDGGGESSENLCRRETHDFSFHSCACGTPYPSNMTIGSPGNTNVKCWLCQQSGHSIVNCSTFLKLSPVQRLAELKKKKGCFFCLRIHRPPCLATKFQCPEMNNGQQCMYKHHKLLHGGFVSTENKPENGTSGNSPTDKPAGSSSGCSLSKTNTADLLPIISGKLSSNKGKAQAVVLLDSGSQLSFIRKSLAGELGLQGEKVDLDITTVGGKITKLRTRIYEVELGSLLAKYPARHTICVLELPQITSDSAPVDLDYLAELFAIDVDSIKRDAGPVDLLVGIDNIEFHSGNVIRKGQCCLRNSIIGPVIFGMTNQCEKRSTADVYLVNSGIHEFWSTEQMGVHLNFCCQTRKRGEKLISALEKRQVQEIESTATNEENRWIMPLPWERDPGNLENNYPQALAKLVSLERRLLKSENFASLYDQQVKDLVVAGSARILSLKELQEYSGPVHYMSHHAILRPEKASTPCRMVFNQKERYGRNKLSVNDCLSKCGDHLNNLLGVVIRFRDFQYVLLGDVRKMYHQVLVKNPVDLHTHRFLWRGMETSRKSDVYVKTVLTFGDVSSPALANLAMDLTVKKYPLDPDDVIALEASRVILEDRYMDDIVTSVEEVGSIQKLSVKIDEILATGHFEIKEWITNAQVSAGREEKCEKVLGILYELEEDKMSIYMKTVPDTLPIVITKRIVTSIISGIFDLFGHGAPITITGKIGLQDLWRSEMDWDDPIPETLIEYWKKWLVEIQKLKMMKFERCTTPANADGKPDLVCFADASRKAFGACLYIRWLLDDGSYQIVFAMAKTRVAPLKEISLARLELQAAVLAARIIHTWTLESRLEFANIYILIDSLIVLGQIQNKSRIFKPFVGTRVGEILTKVDRSCFSHIRSEDNAADEISRGMDADQLERFIDGPEFLKLPVSNWPITGREPSISPDDPECRIDAYCMAIVTKIAGLESIQPYTRLLRITAWVMRLAAFFLYKRKLISTFHTGPVTASDIRNAEVFLVKLAQQELEPLKSYKNFAPFVLNGVVRVGGRMENANLSYDMTYPILLPYSNFLSKLIVAHYHQYGHQSVAATAAKVRRRFWIVGVNRIAKSVVFKCLFCRELKSKTESQIMANLPAMRIQPAPPFYYTAIDLFGPFSCRFRRLSTIKVWAGLFTCLVTRGVYCDVILDYSSMELQQTLRRFFCFRGAPGFIYSDRGSQLVAAHKDIQKWCAGKGVTWQFCTPTAAHQNGCAESLIRTVKKCLKKAIGDTVLTPLEFQTVLFEAMNLVNERPIGILNNDPNDGPYISPNQILMGRASDQIPHGPFVDASPRKRVEFCQKIVHQFWKLWYRDVFPTMVPRKKWQTTERDVKVDDLVLLKEASPIRGQWIRGRIICVYPGPDGRVRNVRVKTKTGEYDRPITKLSVLLPVEEQN